MVRVIHLEGVGPKFASQLEAVGVTTTESLLECASSARGRRELALKAHIDEEKLAEWVNRAQRAEDDLSELMSQAAAVFGSEEAARTWLDSPNRSIGGLPPRRLVDEGPDGIREARSILFRLEHGIYS